MENKFFDIAPVCEYGRSPIQVEAIEEYELFESFNENSSIIKNNTVKAIKGRKWTDIIAFESSHHFLISDNLKTTLEENNVTGINFFPVNIKLKPKKKYYGFYLTHIAGPLLNKKEASWGLEPRKFDESTWNGSDFFTLEGSLSTFITKRVKDILEKEKFTNLEIEPF